MTVQAKGAVLSLALTSVKATMFNNVNCVESFKNKTLANILMYWYCASMFVFLLGLANIHVIINEFRQTPAERHASQHAAYNCQFNCLLVGTLLFTISSGLISYYTKSEFDDLNSKCVVTL